MTDRLPPNLLRLFQPRPPLRYLPPHDHPPQDRRTRHIEGVAAYVPMLGEWEEERKGDVITESWLQKKDRETLEKQKHQKWLTTEGVKKMYKPNEDENIRGDAFSTLFVSRLPYECGTKDLEKEFGRYGPIERIRIVTDRKEDSKKKGKPKGYAFILFEREKDMKAAYKDCENLIIRGRKVMVDVERGRTVNEWRPRRFGGGLGGRHHTRIARIMPQGYGPPPGPGFRGGGRFNDFGGRGDFRGGRGGGRGGFRGGYGGGRGGIGFYGPPDGAPAGPRGPGSGFGRGGYGGGDRDGSARSNANLEPLPPRGSRGYHDRDRDFGGGRDRDGGPPRGGRDRDGGPPRGDRFSGFRADRDAGPPLRGDRDGGPPRGDRDGGPPRGDRDGGPPRGDFGSGPHTNKRPFEGGYDESRQRRRY